MSKEQANAEQAKETAAEKKARIKAEKEAAKEQKAKERAKKKAAKEKEKAEAKANKKPGVIASILIIIQEAKKPITQEGILELLKERFSDRSPESMQKTVRAQLGGKKQPTRMEKERKVVFDITYVQKEQVTKGKKGEPDVVEMVDSKEKMYFYKGEATD